MGIMVNSLLWVMQDFVHQQYQNKPRVHGTGEAVEGKGNQSAELAECVQDPRAAPKNGTLACGRSFPTDSKAPS